MSRKSAPVVSDASEDGVVKISTRKAYRRYTKISVDVPTELYEEFSSVLDERGSTMDIFIRMAMRSYMKMPNEFDLSTKLTFGKYRGETTEDVIRTHPDYIEYCLRKVNGFVLSPTANILLQQVNGTYVEPEPVVEVKKSWWQKIFQ